MKVKDGKFRETDILDTKNSSISNFEEKTYIIQQICEEVLERALPFLIFI